MSQTQENDGKTTGRCQMPGRYASPALITTRYIGSLAPATKLRLSVSTPTLPPSFFFIFKHLRVLDLRRAGLRRLPPQIIELKGLERLDLRYNNLKYLPSQIAQLPNLHQLQIEDVRNRKTRLLKEIDASEEHEPTPDEYKGCACANHSDGQRIPPLPSLAQLCIRTILGTIPLTTSDDPEELSWENLEPFYRTGKFEDVSGHNLPFPSHLLPSEIPVDLCAACYQIAFPIHARFDKVQVVALCSVRLRYDFCSHKCLSSLIERWEFERKIEDAKKLSRQARFHAKD